MPESSTMEAPVLAAEPAATETPGAAFPGDLPESPPPAAFPGDVNEDLFWMPPKGGFKTKQEGSPQQEAELPKYPFESVFVPVPQYDKDNNRLEDVYMIGQRISGVNGDVSERALVAQFQYTEGMIIYAEHPSDPNDPNRQARFDKYDLDEVNDKRTVSSPRSQPRELQGSQALRMGVVEGKPPGYQSLVVIDKKAGTFTKEQLQQWEQMRRQKNPNQPPLPRNNAAEGFEVPRHQPTREQVIQQLARAQEAQKPKNANEAAHIWAQIQKLPKPIRYTVYASAILTANATFPLIASVGIPAGLIATGVYGWRKYHNR